MQKSKKRPGGMSDTQSRWKQEESDSAFDIYKMVKIMVLIVVLTVGYLTYELSKKDFEKQSKFYGTEFKGYALEYEQLYSKIGRVAIVRDTTNEERYLLIGDSRSIYPVIELGVSE